MLTPVLAILALVSFSLQDDLPNKAQLCVVACQKSFHSVTFGTTDPEEWTNCNDTLRWESTWLCSKLHCSPRQIKTGVKYAIDSYCKDKLVPSYDIVIANFSDEAIKNIPILQYTEKPSEDIVNTTLLPSQELFDLAYRTWVI